MGRELGQMDSPNIPSCTGKPDNGREKRGNRRGDELKKVAEAEGALY